MADGWDIRNELLDPLAGCYAEAQRLVNAHGDDLMTPGGARQGTWGDSGYEAAGFLGSLGALTGSGFAPLFWEEGVWEPTFDPDERPTLETVSRLKLPVERGLAWLRVRGLGEAARQFAATLRRVPRQALEELNDLHAGVTSELARLDAATDLLRSAELHVLLLADELTPVFYPGDESAGGGASAGLHADCRYETPVPSGDRAELRRRLMEQAERNPRFTVPTEDGGEFSQRGWGRLVGAAPRTVGTDEFYLMTLDKVRTRNPPRPKRAAVDSAAAAVTRPEDDPLARLVAGEEEDAERRRQIAALTAEQRRDEAADRAGRPGKV